MSRVGLSSIAISIVRRITGHSKQKECKQRAALLRDEALFKDPPGQGRLSCPICFLPMPYKLIARVSPSTRDYIIRANISISQWQMRKLTKEDIRKDNIIHVVERALFVGGCVYSFSVCLETNEKCPFCKAHHVNKTYEEIVEEFI